MTTQLPSIQFFDGVPEELDDVSLRRNRSTGVRSVLMTFKHLNSISQFNSFRYRFSGCMKLIDDEGQISVEPTSVKFYFKGDDGDDFDRLECRFDLDRDDHWERFLRFMNRYAEANGMEYGEPTQKPEV
ncbi:photosystem II reaction center protein Psb28 [Pantanalinema sp. GBBB05]|uniref:photosystem II reaction center protein Psb28 n=1 Tax=Pantanalinema sp. GBBB05 TaxID=2604139 RepID=UPI001DFDD24A|nr:photosystem II reaction center protein Psb28 [Pantanalinema sp. GBBB05]